MEQGENSELFNKISDIVKNFNIETTPNYYKGKYKYDDFYEPFKLDEVEKFEKDNGVTFPNEMKKYITEVSQSIFKNHLGVRDIPLDSKCVGHFPKINSIDDKFYYEDIMEKNAEEYVKIYDIRQLGCGFSDNIVLEGKFIGTIWQDTLASQGSIKFKAPSFYKYLLDHNEMNH